MKLLFERKHEYGRTRYYPLNAEARVIVELAKRECFSLVEIQRLQYAGFVVAMHEGNEAER